MSRNSQIALRGALWAIVSIAATKGMSIISQVVLGHILPIETFAVFALVTSALALTTGFRNSGAQKYLIHRHEDFDTLSASFFAFSLVFGCMGGLALIVIGGIYSISYSIDALWPVIAISALTIPLGALNAIYFARLSVDLKFSKISLIQIAHSLIYYIVLLTIAYLGAGAFSVAVATLTALLFQLYLSRQVAEEIDIRYSLALKEFLSIFSMLKWTILASILFGLSQSGDYLSLGYVLTAKELGQYYFGFMLTANVGLLVASGIAQTFLPLFSRMKADATGLRRAVQRSTVVVLSSGNALCLVIIGCLPLAVSAIWGGKWDSSVFTALVLASTFPVRLLASVAATVLEAKGLWKTRCAVLSGDAGSLVLLAAIGGLLGGLPGASIAVAAQRGLSGIIAYSVAMKVLKAPIATAFTELTKSAIPFMVSATYLFWTSPDRHLTSPVEFGTLYTVAFETFSALILYALVLRVVSPGAIKVLLSSLMRKRSNKL